MKMGQILSLYNEKLAFLMVLCTKSFGRVANCLRLVSFVRSLVFDTMNFRAYKRVSMPLRCSREK